MAQLDAQVGAMTQRSPGRMPCWDDERVMRMDRAALEQGKRCVMWDDQGAGFFLVRNIAPGQPVCPASLPGMIHRQRGRALDANHSCKVLPLSEPPLPAVQMLNWDWVHNRPAEPSSPETAFQPGWWHNARTMLRRPLLDPSVAADDLAAWIDAHTMRVHHRLLERLHNVRVGDQGSSQFVLAEADEYGALLRQL